SAIVFYHIGVTIHTDETEEYEACVGNAFLEDAIDGWLDDALFNFVHEAGSGEWKRTNRAHASGVETFIAFVDAFVVLCFGKDDVILSIGECEYTQLNTA